MIDYEMFMQIRTWHEKGLTCPQIAGKLGLDDRTVEKWLNEERYRQRKHTTRSSKLDPYKEYILRWLEEYSYSSTRIFQKLGDMGFSGGITIVRDYVRKVRPKREKAFLKLAFAPGECAQVDWGTWGTVPVGSTTRKLHFFAMVLCYSRMMYLEFTLSQSMENFLACHQNAFQRLGVCRKIMIDNLKTGVIQRIVGADPVLNPKYEDFARHYGFSIVPCSVGKGNEKGRVENGIGYVKKNFLAGLDITDFCILNPAGTRWLDTICNVRIHGETRRRPVDMFDEERDSLYPSPTLPYDIATVSPVRACRQFRITLDTNRYSVPAEYAGQRLLLKTYPDRICVYHQDKLIARHIRCYDRYQDIEDPDHPKSLIVLRKKARDQKIFMRFLELSPKSSNYYQQLEQRRVNAHHHVAKIVALSDIHGPEAVARAIDDAFEIQAFSSEYIANILEQRSRKLPEPGPLILTRRQDLLDIDIPLPDIDLYDRFIPKMENLP